MPQNRKPTPRPTPPLATSARTRGQFRRALLAWYDGNGRTLPWRTRSTRQTAYKVLVSEILLQQTRAGVIAGRYRGFLRRFPSLKALAEAELDEVLAAWAGLGYYARGRNLHAAARLLHSQHGGRFPQTAEELKTLPGVGDYTAKAIAAIAFEQPVLPLDGNNARVVGRLFAIPNRDSPALPAHAESLLASRTQAGAQTRYGDFAQAMMDLGALLCLPKAPLCQECPVRRFCAAGRAGKGSFYGKRAKPAPRPVRKGQALVVWRDDKVFLPSRPATGLLGGMRLPPMTGLDTKPDKGRLDLTKILGKHKKQIRPCGELRHTFTHFTLILQVSELVLKKERLPQANEADWVAKAHLTKIALPSLGSKILRCADKK